MNTISGIHFAPHVHACNVGNDVVLLDLRADRYFGLNAHDVCSDPSTLKELREHGMLHEGDAIDACPAPLTIPRPMQALIDGYPPSQPDVSASDIINCLMAVLTASAFMRWRRLIQIIRRVERLQRLAATSTFDTERARERMMVFNRIRPLFYTESRQCFLSSLAAQGFLRRYRLFPRLVLGVSTRPFKAHSWLQYDDIVINDTPENVAEYTPILVV